MGVICGGGEGGGIGGSTHVGVKFLNYHTRAYFKLRWIGRLHVC